MQVWWMLLAGQTGVSLLPCSHGSEGAQLTLYSGAQEMTAA